MIISRKWTKKMTCPQSELLLSNNKAWDIDTWYYMDEPRKHPILSKEHQNPACLHVPLNHLSYVHWVKKIRNIKYTGKEKQKSKNTPYICWDSVFANWIQQGFLRSSGNQIFMCWDTKWIKNTPNQLKESHVILEREAYKENINGGEVVFYTWRIQIKKNNPIQKGKEKHKCVLRTGR